MARNRSVHTGLQLALPDWVLLGELAGPQGGLADVSPAFGVFSARGVPERSDRGLHAALHRRGPRSDGEGSEAAANVYWDRGKNMRSSGMGPGVWQHRLPHPAGHARTHARREGPVPDR